MPLMSSLYTGVSGLQSSQNAINTIAHNISNADTKGYTRQQIVLSDRQYQKINNNPKSISNQQYGIGVNYAKCRQVRDSFLDKAYRNENSRQAFYKTLVNSTKEIEDLSQELYGTTFFESLDNFWVSVQELSKDPDDSVNQSMFVARASQFLTQAKEMQNSFYQYQKNLDIEVVKAVQNINDIGQHIHSLNKEIVRIESAGIENANDLRDKRNNLLDELSTYGKITYEEEKNGTINVMFEEHPFVFDSYVDIIRIDYKENFIIPYWERDSKWHLNNGNRIIDNIEGAHVFKLDNINNNSFDMGKLKALVLTRGDKNATFEDLQDGYETKIAPSLMMNIEAEFDNLIHCVVTDVNNILRNAESNPGISENNLDKYLLFKDLSGENKFSLKSIEVNDLLVQNPNILNFKTKDGRIDFDTVSKLNNAFENENFILNPTNDLKLNYKDGYNSLISQISNFGNAYNSFLETQEKTVNDIQNERLSVCGVSTDEELAQMIQFQNMYNASSRYINVVNEMLDHIITKLV